MTHIAKRSTRIRGRLKAHLTRVRLSVFRSNKYIRAQVIDDTKGVTLAAASGKNPKEVGLAIAKAAITAGVKDVAFDRGSYNYHGRVKLLAEGAREGGLNF
jgi:large subunit ribosomal protein L18